MTTITASAKEGIVVCDSRMQTGEHWWPGEKVTRIGDTLVGCAGDSATIIKFIEWLGGDRSTKAKLPDDFNALVLNKDGLTYWCRTLIPSPVERGFHAIGSGGNAALGAMMAGACCKEAVRIACQIDINSGGDIRVHKLKRGRK